eukprot:TRINITY_DN4020_c0_g1_i2.p1 TRINITY_DN4020_c0_g1~~TRINITY_DN4020_c0_g1_i2.p1  ORF type:complete len:480 (+),score=104.43 TRINITY_DN4020_c0_g1_i2:83-1441(+)
MEPAPEFTPEVEASLASVVAAVLADGRNAAAQPFWRFLQRGGRLPAGRLPRAALAGPPVYEVTASADEGSDGVRLAPDLAGIPPLQSASVARGYAAALTVRGEVLCHQGSWKGLAPVILPWPATSVSCGWGGIHQEYDGYHAVALRRGGGAVCEWWVSPSGDCSAREEVRGLPPGDAVIALDDGNGASLALSASGAVYGWGPELWASFSVSAGEGGAAARIEDLSTLRARRVACGPHCAAIETGHGELRCVGVQGSCMQLPAESPVSFPLRDMVTWRLGGVYLVDAAGIVWWIDLMWSKQWAPLRFPPQARGQRVVRMGHVIDPHGPVIRLVTLTDCGELWSGSFTASAGAVSCDWTSLSAARPDLPRGLLPFGGAMAHRVLLLPDLSCGRARLQLFARIAARLGLPSDVVRTALLRAAVQSCYIVGDEDDPFCWPTAAAGAGAAAAASEED